MSRNPGAEVDPSEGTLDEGTNFDESAASQAEEQVDPSEDPQ
jgi:hypothetical protein